MKTCISKGFSQANKKPKNREKVGSGWVKPQLRLFFFNFVFSVCFLCCFHVPKFVPKNVKNGKGWGVGVGGCALTNLIFYRTFGFFYLTRPLIVVAKYVNSRNHCYLTVPFVLRFGWNASLCHEFMWLGLCSLLDLQECVIDVSGTRRRRPFCPKNEIDVYTWHLIQISPVFMKKHQAIYLPLPDLKPRRLYHSCFA